MAVVPQFHVNAWGIPFACTWFGSTQVMPGPRFTPKRLATVIEEYKVTFTAGVPTIWLGLLKELDESEYDISSLRGVLCGGSAAPIGMIRTFEQKYNIPLYHAYRATETTPLAKYSRLKSYQLDLSDNERANIKSRQGLLIPGLEMKIIDDDGEVDWDDETMGE